MKTNGQAGRKLEEQLLLAPRVPGDRLMLADAILLAALDGSRALSAGEQAALRASPLTMRRFRTLSLARRQQKRQEREQRREPANDAWHGSGGMLRAASSAEISAMATDDGHWRLHFLEQDGLWRVILTLDGGAPFAARLVREQPLLRVLDGGGAIVLQGSLDADGECETLWPFDSAPLAHFQQFGATFAVEPVRL